MIVRLAFSVAVNVNADILIVDEALAVGDAIFQHRCFRKIREMQEAGKTILYVGHDTEAVRNLCTQALLLDGGRIIERGDPNHVVNKYYALIADRERAYTEGNLIEHGQVLNDRYETTYDFIRSIKEAKVVQAGENSVREQTIDVNSIPRKIIFAHPPSEITYSIFIDPGASLAFAIGILPGAWDKISQGVKFDIDVIFNGKTQNIFTRVLQPNRNIGDRGWHNFILPLEKFSGKQGSIIFRTSGSGNDLSYGWSGWGWVKLIRVIPDIPEPQTEKAEPLSRNEKDEKESEIIEAASIRYGNKKIEIIKAVICDLEGNPKTVFFTNEKAIIRITIKCKENVSQDVTVGCSVRNKYSVIYGMNTHWQHNDLKSVRVGDIVNIDFLCCLRLGSGVYSITPAVAIVTSDIDVENLDRLEDCLIFRIVSKETMEGFVDLNAKITWNIV